MVLPSITWIVSDGNGLSRRGGGDQQEKANLMPGRRRAVSVMCHCENPHIRRFGLPASRSATGTLSALSRFQLRRATVLGRKLRSALADLLQIRQNSSQTSAANRTESHENGTMTLRKSLEMYVLTGRFCQARPFRFDEFYPRSSRFR
jgi:hypothetical protein